MTDHLMHARLVNDGGELIAEGACWLDEQAGHAMLEPEREPGLIRKERGRLALELDSGRSLAVSDAPMVFRLGENGNIQNGHRSLYKLRLLDYAQDANTAGAAGEGAPALPRASLRENGETPAVR